MTNIPNIIKAAAALVWMTVSMSGCAVIKKSEIPVFIERLEAHSFSASERETIGDLLRYAAELEAR